MKKNYFLLLLAPSVLALFFAGTLFHSGSPGGKTGSPGDGAATCTQCHAGTINPVDNWITSDIPELGYVVGETYNITATGTHAGAGRFGFELTAEDVNGNKVGEFNVINGETQLTNSNAAVSHTSSGITPDGDMKSWTMEWTAPATDIGVVTFYTAVNAADANGTTAGDVIYTSTLSVDESTIGLNDLSIAEFSFGPNPSTGTIAINHSYDNASVKLIDMTGKSVLEMQNYTSGNMLNLNEYKAGIYFIQLQSGQALNTQKMILK